MAVDGEEKVAGILGERGVAGGGFLDIARAKKGGGRGQKERRGR